MKTEELLAYERMYREMGRQFGTELLTFDHPRPARESEPALRAARPEGACADLARPVAICKPSVNPGRPPRC